MSIVVFMVIGFIILGIATPSESAAFGVLGVLILATIFRLLSWDVVRRSFESTIKVGGMVFFIIISSSVFSQLIAYSVITSYSIHYTKLYDDVVGLSFAFRRGGAVPVWPLLCGGCHVCAGRLPVPHLRY